MIVNNSATSYQGIKLSFRLKDFMDFGSDTEVKRLGPGERLEIPLRATLNNRILDVSEDTPIQGEISLTYFQDGEHRVVSRALPLRVYSRNAITWDVPERIANFITPKDPPVLEFAAEVLRRAPEETGVNANLAAAALLWDALSEHGLKFVTNPSNPYETISEDPTFPVDYTQFPRDTLKRRGGQCDDLVSLLAAMLEASRVRTALLDYPGHVALMFEADAEDGLEAGLPASEIIEHEGRVWVPIEATMIGRPFREAVRKALNDYRQEQAKDRVRVLDVRRAWGEFEPATLPSPEGSLLPSGDKWLKRGVETLQSLAAERGRFLKSHWESLLAKNPKDLDALLELGLVEAQAGDQEAARRRFGAVLAQEPAHAAALNNLANVYFIDGDAAGAQEGYLKAALADPDDAQIWLNLLRCAIKLKDAGKAREYGAKAAALDPGLQAAVTTWLEGLE